MGVIELFDHGLNKAPHRNCLVQNNASKSYREVDASTRKIAGALRARGIGMGQCVSVLSPNTIEAYEVYLATQRAGCVFAPSNPRNHVSETVYTLREFQVSALFYHSSQSELIAPILAECSALKVLVCLDRADGDRPSLAEWAADHAPMQGFLSLPRETVTGIFSTGGTTGRPKGVMLTSRVWDVVAATYFTAVGVTEAPVYLLAAPFTHGAGTIAHILLAQAGTIIVHDHFDAGAVLETIERQRVTHFWLPPTAIYMLLSHENIGKHDYSSLQSFMYAGSPMSVEKLRHAISVFGDVMVQGYGQTEAPMFCTLMASKEYRDAPERRFASCGRATAFTTVDVMNDAGELVGPNVPGEIVARGDLVMHGYFNNDAATSEALRDGWLHTGDIGMRDEDGYFYIVDRKKDMVITGGFNVYPAEVEQVLLTHAAIRNCAVFGVPDDKWGEAIKAVVELRAGASIEPDEIVAFCKERLGGVKAPKTAEVWDTLPTTSVGKIDKKKIRETFWVSQTRNI